MKEKLDKVIFEPSHVLMTIGRDGKFKVIFPFFEDERVPTWNNQSRPGKNSMVIKKCLNEDRNRL